jgi:hypothetical protein
MLKVTRRLAWVALLAALLPLTMPTLASAQMLREFTGKVDRINKKKIFVDNRMGDKVSFMRIDETVVEGEKSAWEEVKKDDWVSVGWKFVDKPRKAYKVTVLPPREE